MGDSHEITSATHEIIRQMPDELTTIEGMAKHMSIMARHHDTRQMVQQWFARLTPSMQLTLIRAVRLKTEHARNLLYLAPDATPLLARLDAGLLRRVCDGHEALLLSIEPVKIVEIIRNTSNTGAQRDWMIFIHQALRTAVGKLEAFFDACDVTDLAWFLEPHFGPGHAPMIAQAITNPEALEGTIDPEMFDLLREMAATHFALYQSVLAEIARNIDLKEEWRNRQPLLNIGGVVNRTLERRSGTEEVDDDEDDDMLLEEEDD